MARVTMNQYNYILCKTGNGISETVVFTNDTLRVVLKCLLSQHSTLD